MIQGLSAAYLLPAARGGSVSAAKVSVPVRPLLASTMYFKHVKGVPTRPPAQSLPVFKVQLLDMMLNRLSRLGEKTQHLNQNRPIDERIAAARTLLKHSESARRPFSSGLMMEPGAVVNQLA